LRMRSLLKKGRLPANHDARSHRIAGGYSR
jgi:hypothetical protein